MRRWIFQHRGALVVLLVITLAGGLLRAGPAANPSRYQSVDERAYARLARNLARTGTYGAPEMQDPVRWAPGAPAAFARAWIPSAVYAIALAGLAGIVLRHVGSAMAALVNATDGRNEAK